MENLLTHTFKAPSGTEYTIREQNGQDEEVLTNTGEIRRNMNINNFLQGIIMSSSKKNGKLSMEEILSIPLLDRAVIIIQSRIFSIGEEMEFSYRWPLEGEKFEEFEYTQDLREFLFDEYDRENITKEELENKPKAIPFYPEEFDGYKEFSLHSGKKIRFRLADGHSELYVLKLPDSEKTRNTDFIMRDLQLEVEGKWEKVFNFSLFSVKDMREIRKYVNAYDPTCDLTTDIINPRTEQHLQIPIMALGDFFFPEEDV